MLAACLPPHQVRNLSSCVKVALDFVSPENAHRCVTLTDQFAKLPRGHHLSEDKLQVKTMLLHAMAHISKALTAEGSEALPLPDELPDRVPARQPPQSEVAAAAVEQALQQPPSLFAQCQPCAPQTEALKPVEKVETVASEVDVAMVDAAAAAGAPSNEEVVGDAMQE